MITKSVFSDVFEKGKIVLSLQHGVMRIRGQVIIVHKFSLWSLVTVLFTLVKS